MEKKNEGKTGSQPAGMVVVLRGSRAKVEAERDREMLEWIARFRFVTAEVLAERFKLSPQRVNARLRRLETAGIIARESTATTSARAVFVTGVGARRLGLRVRRAPRTSAQREHELAIARLVAQLETAPGADRRRALTEREQRAAEAQGSGTFSVELRPGSPRGERRRWPDVVLEGGPRTAIELELSTKSPDRLKRIVAGYACCRDYELVRFLVREPPLARRLTTLVADSTRPSELSRLLGLDLQVGPRMSVELCIGSR